MVIIRPIRPEDNPPLAKLYQTVRQQHFIWQEPKSFKHRDYYDSVAGEAIWIAEINRPDIEIVGFISIWLKDSFIHNLFILPKWQRQGIGTKLLEKALECLPPPLTLKVHIDNAPACHFYESRGWQRIDTNEQADEPYHLYRYPACTENSGE